MLLEIAGREIAAGHPLFVVAEIGLNHGGHLDAALALVDAAAAAGAAAVKLQTLHAERLVAPSCPPPQHVRAASLVDFFRQFELDEEAHRAVAARARSRGLAFISTPFDEAAVELLERVGCDAFKIASGDLTHLQLVERVARSRRPMILSTGMAELEEVGEALECARGAGAVELAILHCVSAYPVPAGHENLAAISTLARTFGVPVGLSDHGVDELAPAITVALGGAIYERHIVAADGVGAVDQAVSSTPAGLARAIALAERARRAIGDGRKTCLPIEEPNRVPSRRALYASRPIPVGTVLEATDLVALRPLAGIDARLWRSVIGQTAVRPVAPGTPVQADDLGGSPCGA